MYGEDRDWSNIPFIEGRDYHGEYMKIMIGDESGELTFYGVIIDVRWTEPEYPFRPLKKPFFTFIQDQKHPHNGKEGLYPTTVIAPVKSVISYELIKTNIDYINKIIVSISQKENDHWPDILESNMKTVFSKTIAESYDKLEASYDKLEEE
jgi:hypothetical protein